VTPRRYSYSAFGLGVASTLPLPELVAGDGSADVDVELGPRMTRPDMPRAPRAETIVGADEWQLTFDDVGVITVRGGSRIDVRPIAGVQARSIRLAVLGPAMGVLLQQRGFLVLHASVVDIGGRAVAFLGASGWGKSTMAAALHARGHRLVADDLAAVRIGRDGPEVHSGFPQMKLWPDAVRELGHDPAALPRLERGFEKRARRVREGFATQTRLRLARVFLLDEGPAVSVTPLAPRDAFIALVSHTYGIQWLHGLSGRGQFRDRTEVVRNVPVDRLTRPWNLAALGPVVSRVEAEVESHA
jgi:HPr Serine kinase C-terminal domain